MASEKYPDAVSMYESGQRVSQVARHYGITTPAMHSYLRTRTKMCKRDSLPLEAIREMERQEALRRELLTEKEIVRKFKLTPGSVRYYREKLRGQRGVLA